MDGREGVEAVGVAFRSAVEVEFAVAGAAMDVDDVERGVASESGLVGAMLSAKKEAAGMMAVE